MDFVCLQSKLSERMHASTLSSILVEASQADRAWIFLSASKGVGGWFQANPSIPCMCMTSEEYTMTLWLQLGLPHPILMGT